MGRKALRSWKLLWVPVAVAIALTVAACGGGSSGGDATGSSSPAARALTGTAATGGPVAGTVTLRDSSPTGNRRTTATASDGSYAFDVSGLTAPFMLRVTYGDPASPSALYSFAPGPGTANITPLTSVAAREAVRGASLADFFETAGASDLAAAGSRMEAAVATLQSKLGPLTGRFAVQGNLLTARFTADHTGVDSLLDSVGVDFARAEVTVVAKSSGALLFFCPPADIGAGTFVAANMDLLTTSSPTTGDAQYAAYCAGCHGALSATAKRGITIARLQAAIANDNGKMGFLSMLSPGQMQSIVDALATPTTPSQADGVALYAAACAACHGELSASTKRGATTVRIQNAISGNVGSMGRFASLTAAEIQAIAGALATTTTPPSPAPDGATLYASNCAGCHGPLAASTKKGVSIARLQLAISSDAGGMGYLSRLSVDEIQAIVTALTPGTPTPTPVTPDGPSWRSGQFDQGRRLGRAHPGGHHRRRRWHGAAVEADGSGDPGDCEGARLGCAAGHHRWPNAVCDLLRQLPRPLGQLDQRRRKRSQHPGGHRRQHRRHGLAVDTVGGAGVGDRQRAGFGHAAGDHRWPDAVRDVLRQLPRRAGQFDQGRRQRSEHPGGDCRKYRRHGIAVVAVVDAGVRDRERPCDDPADERSLRKLPCDPAVQRRAWRARAAILRELPRRRLQLVERQRGHAQQWWCRSEQHDRLDQRVEDLLELLPREEIVDRVRRLSCGCPANE